MKIELAAVHQEVPGGYIAFVEELPGADTKGATLEEARTHLEESARLVLEATREPAKQDTEGPDVIREPLRIGAA